MNYGKMETDVNGDQNITINIMCNINGAAGEPRFQIIFLGDDQRRIQVLDENIVLENKKYYYDGAYMALVKLPLKSRLICRVNDTRGSYDSDHGSSAGEGYSDSTRRCDYRHIKIRPTFSKSKMGTS